MREWVDEVILHMTRANYVSLRLGSSLRMKAADALVTCGEKSTAPAVTGVKGGCIADTPRIISVAAGLADPAPPHTHMSDSGHEPQVSAPVRIPLPGKAALIAAGGRRTLCLTEGGCMVELPNTIGLMANPSSSNVYLRRNVALENIGDRTIQQVAGSALHGVLLAEGQVYTWGEGKHGCTGHGGEEDVAEPCRVAGLEGVASIACGHAHTCALTESGEVFTFGWNKYGQLGLGDYETAWTPQRVELPARSRPMEVAAGWAHTAILLENGSLLTTGSGECGQLGSGQLLDRCSFGAADALAGSSLSAVSCGGLFTAGVPRPGSEGADRRAPAPPSHASPAYHVKSAADWTPPFPAEGSLEAPVERMPHPDPASRPPRVNPTTGGRQEQSFRFADDRERDAYAAHIKRGEQARKAGNATMSASQGFGSYMSPLPGGRPSTSHGVKPGDEGDLLEELGAIAHDLRQELREAQSRIAELQEEVSMSDFHNQRLALEASRVPLLESQLEAALNGLPEDVEAALWKSRFEEAQADVARLREELSQRDYEETALMHEAEQVPRLQRDLEAERARASAYSAELQALRAEGTAQATAQLQQEHREKVATETRQREEHEQAQKAHKRAMAEEAAAKRAAAEAATAKKRADAEVAAAAQIRREADEAKKKADAAQAEAVASEEAAEAARVQADNHAEEAKRRIDEEAEAARQKADADARAKKEKIDQEAAEVRKKSDAAAEVRRKAQDAADEARRIERAAAEAQHRADAAASKAQQSRGAAAASKKAAEASESKVKAATHSGSGELTVRVEHAKDWVNKDGMFDASDPYVIVKCGGQQPKTKVIMDNHDPIWNESFVFHLEDPRKESLYLVLMDHNDGSQDNTLGQVVIPVADVVDAHGGMLVNKEGYPTGKKTGHLWATLEWNEHQREASGAIKGVGHTKGAANSGTLTCVVKSAKDLIKADMMSASDPYCVLVLGQECPKTKTIQDNNSPHWDQTFTFKRNAPREDVLVVKVFDFNDDDKPDIELGQVSIPLDEVIDAPGGTLEHGYALGTSDGKEKSKLYLQLNWQADKKSGSSRNSSMKAPSATEMKEIQAQKDKAFAKKKQAALQASEKAKAEAEKETKRKAEAAKAKEKADKDTADFQKERAAKKAADSKKASTVSGTPSASSSPKASSTTISKPTSKYGAPETKTPSRGGTVASSPRSSKALEEDKAAKKVNQALAECAKKDTKQVTAWLKPVLGSDIATEFKANKVTGQQLADWYRSGEMKNFKEFSAKHPTLFLSNSDLKNLVKTIESGL